MAALTPPNVVFNVVPDATVVRMLALEVRKANSGDTIDLSTQMAQPRIGVFIGSTVNVRAAVAVAGTSVTLPAGLTNDSGYVVVLGL